jgi:acyl dehydratase
LQPKEPDVPATDFIGKPTPPQTVVIERGPVSNFAKAVQDHSPVYADPRAAAEAGFAAIPAPPTYDFAMHHWGAFPEEQPEGAGASHPMLEVMGELLANGGLILHGSQEFAYHQPLTVGMKLTSHGTVKDIYSKQSSGGKTMTFVVTETEWRDEQDQPVVTSTMTVLHRA